MSIDNNSSIDLCFNFTLDNKEIVATVLDGMTFNFWVSGVITTIIGVFGITGNIMTLATLLQRDMRHNSAFTYMVGLAVADTLLIVSEIISNSTIVLIAGPDGRRYFTSQAAQVLPLTDPISKIWHTASVYMTVAITIDRYIAICHSFQAPIYCTVSRSKKVSSLILLLSIIITIPHFLEFGLKRCYNLIVKEFVYKLAHSPIGNNRMFNVIYLKWTHFVLIFILPMISLIILNAFIIAAIRRSQQPVIMVTSKGEGTSRQLLSRRRSSNSNAVPPPVMGLRKNSCAVVGSITDPQTNSGKDRDATYMLISVVVAFFILQLPNLIARFLYTTCGDSEQSDCRQKLDNWIYIEGVAVVCNVTNSSINFILYCFFGNKFRARFKKMMQACYQSRGNRLFSRRDQSSTNNRFLSSRRASGTANITMSALPPATTRNPQRERKSTKKELSVVIDEDQNDEDQTEACLPSTNAVRETTPSPV